MEKDVQIGLKAKSKLEFVDEKLTNSITKKGVIPALISTWEMINSMITF